MPVDRRTRNVLAALALLYTAQGIPFGFAAEYLPVVLREMGYSRTQIASLFWLQLPWQLKALWASLGDHPRVRPHARRALLAIQCALALAMAAYAPAMSRGGLPVWFALTFLAALLASTQDVFVDAFAVRSLDASGRGFGNTAQVAGYRVGIIIGGGGMLLFGGVVGAAPTLLACAGLILVAGVGAFSLRDDHDEPPPTPAARPGSYREVTFVPAATQHPMRALADLLRHMAGRGAWRVAALAVTYKLGAHAASALIKPTLVDHGWSRESIGGVVVTLGTGASVIGAVLGGILHRVKKESSALAIAAVVQAVTVLTLAVAFAMGSPRGLTAAAITAEHLGSGLGTTVLFAALMSATDRARAALHYTVLTSLNAVAIVAGGLVGSVVADHLGVVTAIVAATALCLAPCALLGAWTAHAAGSAGEGPSEVEDSLTVRGGSL